MGLSWKWEDQHLPTSTESPAKLCLDCQTELFWFSHIHRHTQISMGASRQTQTHIHASTTQHPNITRHTSAKTLSCEWRWQRPSGETRTQEGTCLILPSISSTLRVLCVHAASHRILLQRLQNWGKARGIREKDSSKGQEGRWDVGRWIGQNRQRERRTWGKRPTCVEGHQDGWKETQGEERDEGEGETANISPSVKFPASWWNSHLQWHFYCKPPWSGDGTQKSQNNATCWNTSGTIWDIKQLAHALGNGLVCS